MRKAHLFTSNKHPVRQLAHLVYYEVLKKSGEMFKFQMLQARPLLISFFLAYNLTNLSVKQL